MATTREVVGGLQEGMAGAGQRVNQQLSDAGAAHAASLENIAGQLRSLKEDMSKQHTKVRENSSTALLRRLCMTLLDSVLFAVGGVLVPCALYCNLQFRVVHCQTQEFVDRLGRQMMDAQAHVKQYAEGQIAQIGSLRTSFGSAIEAAITALAESDKRSKEEFSKQGASLEEAGKSLIASITQEVQTLVAEKLKDFAAASAGVSASIDEKSKALSSERDEVMSQVEDHRSAMESWTASHAKWLGDEAEGVYSYGTVSGASAGCAAAGCLIVCTGLLQVGHRRSGCRGRVLGGPWRCQGGLGVTADCRCRRLPL